MLSKEELTKRWMILEGVCANEDYDPGPILSHIDAQTEQLKEARGLLEESLAPAPYSALKKRIAAFLKETE
jgi:hypothetical protein